MKFELTTVSESMKFDGLTYDFEMFVNEAGPQNFEPSIEKIRKCIKNRRYAGIYYEEDSNNRNLEVLSGFRLIEPLCFGRGYKTPADGHISHPHEYYLRAYVIRESKKSDDKNIRKINRKSVSKSQRVPYFRLFKMERIKIWEQFRFRILQARDEYNPEDMMIAEILEAANFDDK